MPSSVRIHAIARFAGADIGQVVAGSALADVSPCALRFELQFFFLGNGQRCGGRGQFSIAGFAIARPDERSRAGRIGTPRPELPISGPPPGSASGAPWLRPRAYVVKAADRMRSVRVLISIARVADRLFEFHPLPVRIQFIGQNQWDRSAAAGAHLRAVRHQM